MLNNKSNASCLLATNLLGRLLRTRRFPRGGRADVADNHWAAAAIAAAHRAGIVVELADGTFGPDARLTRAQAVAIMNRLLGREPLIGNVTPSWPDVDANHWAFGEIEEASQDHHYLYDADGNETLAVSEE